MANKLTILPVTERNGYLFWPFVICIHIRYKHLCNHCDINLHLGVQCVPWRRLELSAGAPVNFIATSAFRLFFLLFFFAVRVFTIEPFDCTFSYLAKENTHTSFDLNLSTYYSTYISWPNASVFNFTLYIYIAEHYFSWCYVRLYKLLHALYKEIIN